MSSITSISIILAEFIDLMRSNTLISGCVFSHDNSYSESVKSLRSNRNINLTTKQDSSFPFLSFNRSVLTGNPSVGERLKRSIYKETSNPGDVDKIDFCLGEFTINFTFFANDVRDLEDFEVQYLTKDGITSRTTFSINIPMLGDPISYALTWSPLSDINFNKEGDHYMSVSGTLKVSGVFLVASGTSKVILEIVEKTHIRNYSNQNSVLVETTVLQ